jgi:hypothetical protein
MHSRSTDQYTTVGYRPSGEAGPSPARYKRDLRFLEELKHPDEFASIGRENRCVGKAAGGGQRVGFVGDEPIRIVDHRALVDSGPQCR